MANSFEEMVENIDANKLLESGDDCPEDCERTVRELNHPRDSQLGCDRHPDAPETEIVCVHHGIVASR